MKRKSMKGRNILCMNCGYVFDMQKKEIEWYRKNGFKKPSLCRCCRVQRRQEKRKMEKRIERYN